MLKDIRSLVEDRIYDKLNDKIDECLDIGNWIYSLIRRISNWNFILASYDWMMPEAFGVASDYITTTIQFLENTFRAFTHLPVRDCSFVCRIDFLITSFFIKRIYISFLEKSKFG